MAITAEFQYGVTFGKCDSSDWIEWEEDISGEAEAAYREAIKLHLPFDHYKILNDVLKEVYEDIKEVEMENMIEIGDDYAMQCSGDAEVDPDEINDLVSKRDPHTLEFFDLEDLSDDELDEWDAWDLDELPTISDFQEDFEPSSPFDGGYILNVEYADHPEDTSLSREEAMETLAELLSNANGDYTVVHDFVNRCEWLYTDGSLEELAKTISVKLGLNDYQSNNNK